MQLSYATFCCTNHLCKITSVKDPSCRPIIHQSRGIFLAILVVSHLKSNVRKMPKGQLDYEVYMPKQEPTIDTALFEFQGYVSFCKYMKENIHKYGIKLWVCAQHRGLCWCIFTDKEYNIAFGVVARLCQQIKTRGWLYTWIAVF